MSPAKPRKPVATYDDLLAVPDHRVAEILDGELHVSPRPALRHAQSTARLAGHLLPLFDEGGNGSRGWHLLFEPELHLGPDVVVPDVAGWRIERLPVVPDQAFITMAPDWVCETLSPSTERIDRLKKLRIYAREGVRHAWLLNPLARTLEIFRHDAGQSIFVGTYGDDEVIHPEPFDSIPLELGRLWSEAVPTDAAAEPAAEVPHTTK